MDCCSPGDSPFDRQFDARHAAQHLRAYRERGAVGLTRALIEALAAGGVDGQTVLDIGGGVGAVHHGLLRSGAAAAVDVDASHAYIAVARDEAERQGHADRVQYLVGDFVELADKVDPADLVALDRVICCYRDMAALVGRSAALARRRYGLVYPRDSWLGRLGVAFLNAGFRLSRSPFRAYVHCTADVDAVLADHGLVKGLQRTTLIWQLALYDRPAARRLSLPGPGSHRGSSSHRRGDGITLGASARHDEAERARLGPAPAPARGSDDAEPGPSLPRHGRRGRTSTSIASTVHQSPDDGPWD